MKSDNISPAKFREDMVQQWQGIEEESDNPLGGQYFVPVGRRVDLGTPAMTNIFHNQNQFLRTTKMKLVHNMEEMDEVLDIELNEHVNTPTSIERYAISYATLESRTVKSSSWRKNKHGWHVPLPI
jgi:hypothetical protein